MAIATERSRTILVVDDDATFRANVNIALRRAGYNVVETADVQSALSTIETIGDRIDLIIVDLCLPENQSGLDIILAATRRKIPAKIVAASGVCDDVCLEIAESLGADVAIRKPRQAELAAWSLETIKRLFGDDVPAATPTQRLVVVADDEESIRQFVKKILQHAGYQVLEAADGATALTLVERIAGGVDLLITDYEMPKMNGVALVRAVRAKYPQIPVVYMSGYVGGIDGESLDDRAHECAFIPKPFFPKAFLQLVTEMAGKSTQKTT